MEVTVSFTHWPIYLRSKSPRYVLYRRLGGPQSRSGHGGEERNIQPLHLPGSEARSPSPETRLLTYLPRNRHINNKAHFSELPSLQSCEGEYQKLHLPLPSRWSAHSNSSITGSVYADLQMKLITEM